MSLQVATVPKSDMLETECVPPLKARQYRRLWLDAESDLGLIAECLADALGWQPTETQPLPNALELAEVAAGRLAAIERVAVSLKVPPRTRHLQGLTAMLN